MEAPDTCARATATLSRHSDDGIRPDAGIAPAGGPTLSTAEALERELLATHAPARPDIPDDPTAVWPNLRSIGTRPSLRAYLRDLWLWRNFILTVPMNELRAQNQDTLLGQIWHLLNPLFLAMIYYVIFGLILGISRGGVENYSAFLIVGVIVFNYTRTSVRSGAKVIVTNRKLVQTINFPRAALPLSTMIEGIVSHSFGLAVMWIVLMVTGVRPSMTWLLVVPLILLHSVFNLGLVLFTARFTFHFRDVQNFLPYVLRIWFYVSGVLIPIEARFVTQPNARAILQANPVYIIIEIARDAFIDGTYDLQKWLIASAWAVGLLLAGFLYFRRAESEYGLV
jgi:teichoic acid transport system permease protein